ncbi:5-formyltetrahydrofolate cyclo-ligase [Synechococcus sp. PCC 7336]|uniref:5-formyltetrahydrofolate cyclo-ligase n=1 Tax=Synechococcus sp. PCC 7336 TaxID=195250 RepID=UPI000348A6F2|nr:5-formyltetrahydrofolate cyclo-ligase [Synechococcus sp. PCC 7336]
MPSAACPQPKPSKSELRRYYRSLRGSLDIANSSQQICDRLLHWPPARQAKVILAYWAAHSEVDLRELMRAWPDKTWGLPRTLPEGRMAWHRYDPAGDGLVPARFGLMEPSPTATPIDGDRVDLVLVPALACDRWGIRLGYGGGYYDRCLSVPPFNRCLTVGIVPRICYVGEPLPRDNWDVELGAIATEEGIDCVWGDFEGKDPASKI